MADSGNKGEWSEFYTLLKLITEKKVHAADEDLNVLPSFYPILKVTTDKGVKGSELGYDLRTDNIVQIVRPDEGIVKTIQVDSLRKHVKEIFEMISSKTNRSSFAIKLAEDLFEVLCKPSLRASTVNKADIFVLLEHVASLAEREIGFSIKSQVGAKASLLNASGATNFIYIIDGIKADGLTVNEINSLATTKEKIEKIYAMGGSIKFESLKNQIFCTNLRKIDSFMPEIMAELVLTAYSTGKKRINKLVDLIEAENPFESKGFVCNSSMYHIKVRSLLMEIALGMIPSKDWDGSSEANGGYLIVKSDGDVVCYHIYDRDIFKRYLINNTYLEAPSRGRHKYGIIYLSEGKLKINLNLQIRFSS
ncbi:MAG: HpaII family restriction endonuclease [Patescibacteria group bacterium]